MLTMKGENMEELTTAESMVMKTIWDHPHEMALQEIMKLTNETYGKDWKSQTVSTYIAKLVKKGFLRMNQSGRNAAGAESQICKILEPWIGCTVFNCFL